MSSQGDRPRHDRAAGQHGSGLRAADKRVNMAGAHCVCDGEVYGMNEVLRRRVKDSVILYSFGVRRYGWAFSKRMSRGTGCVNCARPGLWGSPSGNRGALPGKGSRRSLRRKHFLKGFLLPRGLHRLGPSGRTTWTPIETAVENMRQHIKKGTSIRFT